MLRLIGIACLFALIGCTTAQESADYAQEVCMNGVVYYAFSIDGYRAFSPKFTQDSKVVPCKREN